VNWRIYGKLVLSASLMIATVALIQSPLSAQTVSMLAGNHPLAAETMVPSADADPQQPLSMAVTLSLHNRGELDALLADQQDPTSPEYHRWLTPAQFAARFGPSASEVEAVESWLAAQGFKVTAANAGRRVIKFTGTVGQANRAFNVSLKTFGNTGAYANVTDPEIPARFAGVIGYIGGLDNMHAFAPAMGPIASAQGRRLPDSAAASDANPESTPDYTGPVPQGIIDGHVSFAPADLQTFYDEKPLLKAHLNGASAGCIAIVGDSDYLPGALKYFTGHFHLPAARVTKVLADSSAPGFNDAEAEALLDLEWSHVAAPNAPIKFYAGVALEDAINAAVTDSAPCGVISISFAYCGDSAFYQGVIDPMFVEAAGQGQSIMVAAGDWGAAGLVYSAAAGGCVIGDSRNASEMAADPNVTAVGGTSFNPNYDSKQRDVGSVPETVWNDSAISGGATGGGASAIFAKPAYQSGEGVPNDGARDIPDVSLIASPNSPGVFAIQDGSCFRTSCKVNEPCCNGKGPLVYAQFGGTSLSAPVWAGISRLIAQAASKRFLGNLNPTIYNLAGAGLTAAGLRDVVNGNNSFNGVIGYSAGPGYDQCTGWGTVDIADFVKAYDSTRPGPPVLTVKPAQIVFKPVAVGKSARKRVSIANPSKSAQKVWATIQTVTAGGDFSADQNCVGVLLAPGKRCKFTVTFAPTAPGPAAEATVEITDNAGNSPQTVTLDGAGK
jgi:subtilase family serine protease